MSSRIREDWVTSWCVATGIATANNALAASNASAIVAGWIRLSRRFILASD